ncbi:MAG: hypothetical protein LBJ71_03060 [Holosporaceae bacterium]|jgi:hypothetical protein|nr:hypothetical protein [Holosporaceae bacterium]
MKKNIKSILAATLVFGNSTAEELINRFNRSPINIELPDSFSAYGRSDKVVILKEPFTSEDKIISAQQGETDLSDYEIFTDCLNESNWDGIDRLLGREFKISGGDNLVSAIIVIAWSTFSTIPHAVFPEITRFANIASLLQKTASVDVDCKSMIKAIKLLENLKLEGEDSPRRANLKKAREKLSERFFKSGIDTFNPLVKKDFSLPFWAAYLGNEELASFFAPLMFEKDPCSFFSPKFRKEIFLAARFGCSLALKYIDPNYYFLCNSQANKEEKKAFKAEMVKFYSEYGNDLLEEVVASNDPVFTANAIKVINQFTEISIDKVLGNQFTLCDELITKFCKIAQETMEAEKLYQTQKAMSEEEGENPKIERNVEKLKKKAEKSARKVDILKNEINKNMSCLKGTVELINTEAERIDSIMNRFLVSRVYNGAQRLLLDLSDITTEFSQLQQAIAANDRKEQINGITNPILNLCSLCVKNVPVVAPVVNNIGKVITIADNAISNEKTLDRIISSKNSIPTKLWDITNILLGNFMSFGRLIREQIQMWKKLLNGNLITLQRGHCKRNLLPLAPTAADIQSQAIFCQKILEDPSCTLDTTNLIIKIFGTEQQKETMQQLWLSTHPKIV